MIKLLRSTNKRFIYNYNKSLIFNKEFIDEAYEKPSIHIKIGVIANVKGYRCNKCKITIMDI